MSKLSVIGPRRASNPLYPCGVCFLLLWLGVWAVRALPTQVESVPAAPAHWTWVSHGRVEGHLALRYSPAGAFSPESSTLAVVSEDKVVLMDLARGSLRKVLRPRVPDITDLGLESASFLDSAHLLLLAGGLMHPRSSKGAKGSKDKAGGAVPTPLLAFQWDAEHDAVFGKVNAVGAGGGYGPVRYFSQIRYLATFKNGEFILYNPVTSQGSRLSVPALDRRPNLYEFSPDGHWLLLAQLEGSGTADPIVVKLSEHQFVDSLRGHQGTVLSMAFSRDGKKVVTGCEDGKIRIWSVPDWKLLLTLAGHEGPVHWAEFSPDGERVASAGEDNTMRIWSAEDGKVEQTLHESQTPLLTVTFSPNGEYVAASSDQLVHVWHRARSGP